jgi:hypothetical protein
MEQDLHLGNLTTESTHLTSTGRQMVKKAVSGTIYIVSFKTSMEHVRKVQGLYGKESYPKVELGFIHV